MIYILLSFTLIICIVLILLKDRDDKIIFGTLTVPFLIFGYFLYQGYAQNISKRIVSDFIEDYSQYFPSAEILSVTLTKELLDGCFMYKIILIDQDSTYTYSAVMDPQKLEIINFIPEETIPRFKNY